MRFSRNSASDRIETIRREGEERDAQRRATVEVVPYWKENTVANKEILNTLEENVARSGGLAVIARDGESLTILLETTENQKTKEILESLKNGGYNTSLFITTKTKLDLAWEKYSSQKTDVSQAPISDKINLEENTLEEIRKKTENRRGVEEFFRSLDPQTATSALLGYILGAALALRASDVHVERNSKKESLLRFRIDGELRDVARLEERQSDLLVGRVKLLAGLKLNIRDSAQDGRFTIDSKNGQIEVKFSVVPAEFGEAVVMRVLDPSIISLGLKDLGLREDDEDLIEKELKRPNGMILVTGPTGSGKTTTLYAFLKKLNTQKIKIITIEDPIEYHIGGVEQTQTDKKNNYTFATGLRAVLRQDPDVILIGEIRDEETAKVSIDAALTGHLVLSTLHTNNAAGAIPRLVDLGVRTSTIAPAVRLIIAQRLVRKLCPSCKKRAEVDEALRVKIKTFKKGLPKRVARESMEASLYDAVGCSECEDGFRGRLAIMEMLTTGSEIESLIKEKAIEKEIEAVAINEQGMVLMQQDGIIKALQGKTTLSEVEQATGPIEW